MKKKKLSQFCEFLQNGNKSTKLSDLPTSDKFLDAYKNQKDKINPKPESLYCQSWESILGTSEPPTYIKTPPI